MNLKQEYESGISVCKLALKYNIPISTIYSRLQKLNTIMRHGNDAFKPKHHLNTEIFNNLNDIGAYWLGMLYADGYIGNNIITTLKLQKSDSETIKRLAEDLGYSKTYAYGNTAILRISNRPLAKSITNYLGSGDTYKKHLPIILDELLPHFVRGLLDGDGYIGTVKRKDRPSNIHRLDFTFQYQQVANEFVATIEKSTGIKMNGPYKRSTCWTVMASNKKAKELAKWIYQNPTRAMGRKIAIFHEWAGNEHISL